MHFQSNPPMRALEETCTVHLPFSHCCLLARQPSVEPWTVAAAKGKHFKHGLDQNRPRQKRGDEWPCGPQSNLKMGATLIAMPTFCSNHSSKCTLQEMPTEWQWSGGLLAHRSLDMRNVGSFWLVAAGFSPPHPLF